MMKFILTLLISLYAFTSIAQRDTTKTARLDDSVCLRKAEVIIQQMKSDTVKAKFHYDDNFLIALVRKLSPPQKTAIRILNLGDAHEISFSILDTKLTVTDSAGKTFDITVTAPIELIKGSTLSHCESASIDLSKYKFDKYDNCIIQQAKIKLVFGDKEIIAVIGREL